MTRYMDVTNKIESCNDAAKRTTGAVREMWKRNAAKLTESRGKLTLEDAEKEA